MNDLGKATSVDYGPEEAAMRAYCEAGARRAHALGNRGPIRFDPQGHVDRQILEAYSRCGFYVFEGVLPSRELTDIESDFRDILDRLPTKRGSMVDHKGRPALGADLEATTLYWAKPLGDPFGGTELANGRHPVKMFEPAPAADAPDEVVYLILGSLQFSDAALCLYGHPYLLAIAAAVNGGDFAPFNEGIFIKEPGRGASVAWHQDGTTHWDKPDWDEGSHGFNFMAQLYGCTPANGVWVIPGSHKLGRADIRALVAAAGTERLPQAVPLVCNPGDVVMTNRQVVHGSFANTSTDWRVTLNFGFHRRGSVLGVKGGGLHNAVAVYDAARIEKRSEAIRYAIEARRQRYPDESAFVYEPQVGKTFRWDANARAALKDYNLLDLSI
ncbi:MAG: phytanoyl-CoA dioxygenase family protein [Betaproteobacteria bacterium]